MFIADPPLLRTTMNRTADSRRDFTSKQGQYLAFIHAYTLVNGRPPAEADMVHAGNLDAAEQAAHDLLARFPDVHDGYDRLGMVCEARGDHRQAADYYRKAINVIRNHPDAYDPAFEAVFQKLIDRLEPKADAAAD
jgi:tetratricopeptide (TPR) repeat protein